MGAHGLQLTSRKVIGKNCVVATWIPDASFADEGGFILDELVWAVLDCPGGWAIIANGLRVFVLGRIVGELIDKVKPGEKYVVTAWQISEDGRKSLAGEAIYTESGKLVAKSKTLWIELKPDNPFVNDNSAALKERMSS
ncbi:MAG: hypothetical protein EOM54_05125 [Clostridia bacterium]|nr:hypothetical protein [Clostridia bacterium]